MKRKILIPLLLALLAGILPASAKELNLLPTPHRIEFSGKNFVLDRIRIESSVLHNDLVDFVAVHGGTIDSKAAKILKITLTDSIQSVPVNQAEAYRLLTTPRSIEIQATTPQGAYWALQTLAQLETQKGTFTGAEVIDWPAFAVRGFMHDVGRSFLSVGELKKHIALLSRYKINVFHWHLTEYQSWRMESRIFPMINDSCNTTRFPGQYYTIDQAKEVVEWAKRHHVLVIPEFDMPGHSAAFERTFRHTMQSPEGKKILKLLIDEVCETFDVPYLHIGTDEVAFVDREFVPEMVEFVRQRGKKVISWAPGWHYKQGEIDMTQMWSYRGKPTPGIPAIDSRFHYLNHFDTFGDIIGLYTSNIYHQNQGNDDIAGVIIAVWNDRLVANERNIVLENFFYPNALAVAERAWLGGGTQYFDKTGTILHSTDQPEYRMFQDFERRMLYHKEKTFKNEPFGYVKQTHAKWLITDPFPNGGNLNAVFPPEEELAQSYTYQGKEYGTHPAIGNGVYLRHVWGNIIPAFFKEPAENSTAYAYTWVYSAKAQQSGVWIEFQNYGRSEGDLPPAQGTWDYKGSRIWLNNQEIAPPVWSATHTTRSNEIALGNENCVNRPPVLVELNKGWNKVFIKLPVGKFTHPSVRLVKWMFTVAFVTPDGQDAMPGIKYSTDRIR